MSKVQNLDLSMYRVFVSLQKLNRIIKLSFIYLYVDIIYATGLIQSQHQVGLT